jgi:NAD(P)-dependent dehydrogenase (short-subunit alcohol dehydrogenase family)
MVRGVVLVTGASTGIGEATALRLARLGFTVLAGVRRDEDGQRLVAADPRRPSIVPVRLDVTRPEDIAAVAGEVDRRSAEGLAGLVNNAGIAVAGPVESLAVDEWRRQLEVNLIGQIAVTRAMLPALLRARGRVVNMGSIGGRVALPLLGPYAVSKFGIEAFTDTLRRELRPHGVGVVCVEPGGIATPIWDKSNADARDVLAGMSAEARQRYARAIELAGRFAAAQARHGLPPSEVAEVVARALTATRPRTRYVIGRPAKVQAVLARVLPDRAFDALLARTLRL